jgi:hypothetical protein
MVIDQLFVPVLIPVPATNMLDNILSEPAPPPSYRYWNRYSQLNLIIKETKAISLSRTGIVLNKFYSAYYLYNTRTGTGTRY